MDEQERIQALLKEHDASCRIVYDQLSLVPNFQNIDGNPGAYDPVLLSEHLDKVTDIGVRRDLDSIDRISDMAIGGILPGAPQVTGQDMRVQKSFQRMIAESVKRIEKKIGVDETNKHFHEVNANEFGELAGPPPKIVTTPKEHNRLKQLNDTSGCINMNQVLEFYYAENRPLYEEKWAMLKPLIDNRSRLFSFDLQADNLRHERRSGTYSTGRDYFERAAIAAEYAQSHVSNYQRLGAEKIKNIAPMDLNGNGRFEESEFDAMARALKLYGDKRDDFRNGIIYAKVKIEEDTPLVPATPPATPNMPKDFSLKK